MIFASCGRVSPPDARRALEVHRRLRTALWLCERLIRHGSWAYNPGRRINNATLNQPSTRVRPPLFLPCILLLGVLAFAPRPLQAQDVLQPTHGAIRFGDDRRWSAPHLAGDDAPPWQRLPIYALPDTQAVFWLRTRVTIEAAPDSLATPGLFISILAAYEVYWDGVLIGRSGRVGTGRRTERPGPVDARFAIPDSLFSPGTHTLALRLSTFHLPESITAYLYGLAVGDYDDLAQATLASTLLPLFFLGGFFIIGLYYGVLYVLDRRRTALLLFSLLCFAVCGLLVAESWRWAVGYTYDRHLARLLAVAGLTAAIGVLLPSFFVVQFRPPRPRLLLGGLVALLALSLLAPGYDGKSYFMFWSMLGVSAYVTGRALLQRERGGALAFGGVLACLLALLLTGHRFLDAYFFPAFSVLVVCMLSALGLQMREQRRQHEAARLTAARLEIELLKKHLQPHFLMNTLTSAMGWLEEHPQTGARFIEALAEELHLLADISGERLIPMAQELALCRTHLELMGYRRDVRFHLRTHGIDENARVPPALFHTLIENGITHNVYHGDAVTFHLREEHRDGVRRYRFETPLEGTPAPAGAEGTGLRYVRARLDESFGERWSLVSEPRDGAWHTTIEIPA